MMNKKQTSLRSIWKYALILPVIALLLIFNSTFKAKAEPDFKTNIVQTDNEMNLELQNPVTTQDKPTIYSFTDVPPQFPGGEPALMKWLRENIQYPKNAMENGIQGTVIMRFVIKPDGSVEDVKVIKDLDPACDEEATRVVKKMPKWIPGKQNGDPVHTYYSLPIRFRLDSGDSTKPETTSSVSAATTVTLFSDLIIEIDGKAVSDEEWKNFDKNTVKSIDIDRKVRPNRVLIKTK